MRSSILVSTTLAILSAALSYHLDNPRTPPSGLLSSRLVSRNADLSRVNLLPRTLPRKVSSPSPERRSGSSPSRQKSSSAPDNDSSFKSPSVTISDSTSRSQKLTSGRGSQPGRGEASSSTPQRKSQGKGLSNAKSATKATEAKKPKRIRKKVPSTEESRAKARETTKKSRDRKKAAGLNPYARTDEQRIKSNAWDVAKRAKNKALGIKKPITDEDRGKSRIKQQRYRDNNREHVRALERARPRIRGPRVRGRKDTPEPSAEISSGKATSEESGQQRPQRSGTPLDVAAQGRARRIEGSQRRQSGERERAMQAAGHGIATPAQGSQGVQRSQRQPTASKAPSLIVSSTSTASKRLVNNPMAEIYQYNFMDVTSLPKPDP